MRNVNMKIPWTENPESDLEEGEIPEFEVPSPATNKGGILFVPQKVQSLKPLDKLEPKKERRERYGSPPSEGEYVSEEEKLVRGNQILQKDLYKNNISRTPKYVYPFQTTYGSVEDIMSKIGESLGRNSSYYYKGRRSKDYRCLFNVSCSRDINSVLRESSPVFKRSDCNYYKRRRSESDSDPVSNISGKYGNAKYKNVPDSRTGQGITKKRKRERGQIIEDSLSKTETSKKFRFLDKRERGCHECNKNKQRGKKLGINTRLFKEIPLPQEQELGEIVVKEVLHSDDSNAFLDNPSDSFSRKDMGNNFVNSTSKVNWDDCSVSRNSTDLSEQLNDEDNDDDLELIKLRLLALTSNKKKSQNLTGDGYRDNIEDFKVIAEQNVSDSKSEMVDNKSEENSCPGNKETVSERRTDNDIDRYELFLRAEALKTALLKKHQRIIKKRKNFSSSNATSHDSPIENFDTSCENEFVDAVETNVVTSDKEPVYEENQESHIDLESEVVENNEKGINRENNKEIVTRDVHPKDGLITEKLGIPVKNDPPEKSRHLAESTHNSEKLLSSLDNNLKNVSKGFQFGKKKIRRTRLRKVKKSIDLNESNVKENSVVVCEKDEITSSYSLGPHDESAVESGEKFILVDQFPISNCEKSSASNMSGNQPPSPAKQNLRSTVNGRTNEDPAVKVPAPDIERIIVHLGSESSDEECVPQTTKKPDTVVSVEPKEVKPLPTVPIDSQNNIIEYEKRVELLLKGARSKIEKESGITTGIPSTPEAVYNHLAPSQRLEYIRLKQKIAEREKFRKSEKNGFPSSSTQERSENIIDSISIQRSFCQMSSDEPRENSMISAFKNRFTSKEAKNSFDKNYGKFTSNTGVPNGNNVRLVQKQASSIKNPLNGKNQQKGTFITLNTLRKNCADSNSKSVIKKSAEKSIIERRKMLTQNRLHLERLKILWKNIKIEKMIEGKYERELKKLKVQQNFFELKINQQRLKIKKLAEESKQIYDAFQRNNERVEVCSKKKKVPAKEGKVEAAGDKSKGDVIPEKAGNDANLIAKDTEGKNVEMNIEEKVEGVKKTDLTESGIVFEKNDLKEYNSPLQILTSRSESLDNPRVDPNVIMCQFDLLGKCNDEECVYQHWRV